MFNFELKKTAIIKAVLWQKFPLFGLAKHLKKIFLFIFILFLIVFIYGFFLADFTASALSLFFGILIISISLCLIFWNLEKFLDLKLKKPKPNATYREAFDNPDKINLADFLDFEPARAAWDAINFARSKRLSEINSSLLLYFVLFERTHVNFIFSRAELDLVGIREVLGQHLKTLPVLSGGKFEENYSEDFQNAILASLKTAEEKNHERVETGDILIALAHNDPFFEKILVESDLKAEDIENLVSWLESLEKKITKFKKFWDRDNLAKKRSLGKDWAGGYTLSLDQFSTDLTEIALWQEEFMGCGEQIADVERILSQEEIHNVLLVGEPGTGRKGMIQALAKKVAEGRSLPVINYKRIVALDVVSILARCQSQDEVEQILNSIFSEAAFAENVILVIDEFYSFISQQSGRLGTVDIAPILLRYLRAPNFRLIGITSYAGLHLFIEKNPSILESMTTVEVPEATEQDTILILENKVLGLEQKYKKFVSYKTLRDIVKYAGRYIKDVPFPKKALDLLEEVVFYAVNYTNNKFVLPEYVAKIISKKTDIPVGSLAQKEKDVLLDLENLIHQRIINQEEAVNEVASALRRARADITIRKGPMGCFLFLGPTGVGKTETAKALAEVYFGSRRKMIRLDMSEFQRVSDIPRLLGTTNEEGLLTTAVRENPFSLVLLDEIEKAHQNILNLFLQILDEGYVTDGLGRKTDFKNTIIISTSNAGYKVILDALKDGKGMEEIKSQLLDFLFKEGVFRPEFVNRFDALVIFKSLSKENLLDISGLLLGELKNNLDDKGVEFDITQNLKEKIVELSYNPVFGAREMKRVIQDKIENVLAVSLLSGELKRGDRVEVDPENFKVLVNRQGNG